MPKEPVDILLSVDAGNAALRYGSPSASLNNVMTAYRMLRLRGRSRTPNPRIDNQVVALAKKELLRGIVH